jgi:flagellar basal-body rod protein FlgF
LPLFHFSCHFTFFLKIYYFQQVIPLTSARTPSLYTWHPSCKTLFNGKSAKKIAPDLYMQLIALVIYSICGEHIVDRALYIAMTGAKNNMAAQSIRANNMANLNTSGFKADFEQSRSMGVYYGDGQPTRAYALTETPGADFDSGPMQSTGNPMDVAIQGEGFIAVQAPDGSEAYTRAGNLAIDESGTLRTANGLAVMGNSGPISLPPLDKIEIGSDGTISVITLGQTAETMVETNRIKLVKPELKNLEKSPDGLFRQRDGLPAAVDATVRVAGGVLEGSNVNAMSEFTQIISLARQFDMQLKLMKAVEDNSSASAQLLQMS